MRCFSVGVIISILMLSYLPIEQSDKLDDYAIIKTSSTSFETTYLFSEFGENLRITNLAQDSSQNTIIAGYVYQSGSIGDTLIEIGEFQQAGFIAKISQEFEVIWSKVFDDTARLSFQELLIDSSNNLHILGSYEGIFVDGDLYSESINDNTHSFLAKLSANGDFIYFNDFDISGTDFHLTQDESEDIWLTHRSSASGNYGWRGFLIYNEIQYGDAYDFGNLIIISKIEDDGNLTNPFIFRTNMSLGSQVTKTVHTSNATYFSTSILADLFYGDEQITCLQNSLSCSILVKINHNNNDVDFTIIPYEHVVMTRDLEITNEEELVIFGNKFSTVNHFTDSYGILREDYDYRLSCPFIAKLSIQANLLTQTECNKTDESYTQTWGIQRGMVTDDDEIIIIGHSYGPVDFANASLFANPHIQERWLALVSNNLTLNWSFSPNSTHNTIISPMYLDLNFMIFANLVGETIVIPTTDGLMSMEIYDIDGDGIDYPFDLCQSNNFGYISNETSDYDSDGCRDSTEDLDDDNDGWPDDLEITCLSNPLDESIIPVDTDLDSACDELDDDDDNDGFNDSSDAFPLNNSEWSDLDSDGFGDNSDDCIGNYGTSTIDRIGCIDQDGDGISDLNDEYPYDSSRSTSNYVESESEESSSESNSTLYIITILVIISIVIIFYFRRRSTLDDDDSELEELYVSGHNNEQENIPIMQKPDFTVKGEDHESGYEVIEYPQDSDTWWWKDYETETWVLWE